MNMQQHEHHTWTWTWTWAWTCEAKPGSLGCLVWCKEVRVDHADLEMIKLILLERGRHRLAWRSRREVIGDALIADLRHYELHGFRSVLHLLLHVGERVPQDPELAPRHASAASVCIVRLIEEGEGPALR